MFLRAFWEAQMHAYEHAAGWVRHNDASHLSRLYAYDHGIS
jgi:hypothetical protein